VTRSIGNPRLPGRRVRVALAAAVALALAGCGGAKVGGTSNGGSNAGASGQCGTVNLAVNPWVGYEADAAVYAYVAENKLGCTVVKKDLKEQVSWQGFGTGEVDLILENWGHPDLVKKYITDQKVAVDLGQTGNKGIIGWYVPPWLAQAHPDITDWQNLNKYAHLFETPTSGDKGQLLDGAPTYVTNDEALVRNLDLDFTVKFAGSEEALIKAFREAEEQHTPLLGYFYSPQWLLSEIPLEHVALPAYTPGCDADPRTVACDYQPYDLDKIANKAFADSGSPAVTLVKNFQWTNDDQNEVARDITVNNLTLDQAAKNWLAAHRAQWQRWLPATEPDIP